MTMRCKFNGSKEEVKTYTDKVCDFFRSDAFKDWCYQQYHKKVEVEELPDTYDWLVEIGIANSRSEAKRFMDLNEITIIPNDGSPRYKLASVDFCQIAKGDVVKRGRKFITV